MNKRKLIYLMMTALMLTPVVGNINNESVVYAAEVESSESIYDIQKIFEDKKENVDYLKYIGILSDAFEKSKADVASEEFLLSTKLLVKATIETLNEEWIKEVIGTLESLDIDEIDVKTTISSHLVKLYRSLGDVKSANEVQKNIEKESSKIKNKTNLANVYFNQAHGDIVDIKMKKTTLSNLEKAIKILEKQEDAESKKLLILSYIDLSQVELYFNKDAASAVKILKKAHSIATELKNAYFSNVIDELNSHTLPFYFKYEEGIAALKPIVKYYEENELYSEAYRAQHKLVTLMFDSGHADALKEGEKLGKLVSKIKNPSKKEYYKDYSQSLYLANVNAVNGTFKKGIDILENKDFSKYDHIYSIDYSVTNMYLGNLYSAIGDNKKSLHHFELMMKAIVENSNDNAFVYTDTTSYLAQAYYSLGRYQEGYEVLQKHIQEFVAHDMDVNKKNTEELNKQYELERKNARLLELELKHERESYKTKMSFGLVGGLVIIIGILFIERRKVKEYNKRLAKLSITDGLTGLANRRSLDEFLGTQSNLLLQLNKVDEKEMHVSAIMIDIDFFKKYNDNYGHVKGDKVLQEVGEILSEVKADIVARYGGEEFAIILTNTNKAEALQIASKIKARLAEAAITHEFSEVDNIVTISVGLSTKNILVDSIDTLIEDADKALYYSKTHGRNTFTHYDDCK